MCATSRFTGRTDDWCLLRTADAGQQAAHSYCSPISVSLANRATYPSDDYPPSWKAW